MSATASTVSIPAAASRGTRRLSNLWLSRVVVVATLLGCVLRTIGAQGELGLDELWTLHLVARVSSFGQVFWGISHDNNHVLNSAWLYLIGPKASILVERLPAIVLGSLTVPAVARWLGRTNPEAGAIGAVLAAVALPLVDFGSEARGYAGLVLASVIALDEAERGLDAALGADPKGKSPRHAWRLGAAMGFGFLCHLGMIYTAATIAIVALYRGAAMPGLRRAALVRLMHLAWPTGLLVLPAAACLIAGVVNRGGFTIGDRVPFSLPAFVDGFGNMLLLMSGLPAGAAAVGILGTAGWILFAWQRRVLGGCQMPWAVAALVVLPAVVIAARLPNVGYPRYYVMCGLVLLALEAEALGSACAMGGRAQTWALALLAALLAGHLILDARQFSTGRGDFVGMAAAMQADGPAVYTTDYPAMGTLLLSTRPGLSVPAPRLVATNQTCTDPPRWYVAFGLFDPRPDGTATVGPESCRVTYRRRLAFEAAPLSGTQATLYRRLEP